MSCRVSFFKTLLSTDGHQYRCLQQSIACDPSRQKRRRGRRGGQTSI
jgi:hypothetical protein